MNNKKLFSVFLSLFVIIIYHPTNGTDDFGVGRNLYASCIGETPNTFNGTCMTRGQCLLRDGTVSGTCERGSGVCCLSAIVCEQTSSLKRTFISRPIEISEKCTYNIKPYSNRVCQLRIDFMHLNLEYLPDDVDVEKCSTESMTIEDMDGGGKNIILCGRNIGQHVYVSFNATENLNINKKIIFKLNPVTVSSWQILITQLECPQNALNAGGRSLASILNLSDDITVIDQLRSSLSHNPRISYDDMYWLAPIGCLQYYPDTMGLVKSFNFDNTNTMGYIMDMDYSICFRKTNINEQITLEFNHLQIGESTNFEFDSDCIGDTPDDIKDHLLIPKALVTSDTGNTIHSYFCGFYDEQEKLKIVYSPNGPFVIYFFSDLTPNSPNEVGFSFNYSITNK